MSGDTGATAPLALVIGFTVVGFVAKQHPTYQLYLENSGASCYQTWQDLGEGASNFI